MNIGPFSSSAKAPLMCGVPQGSILGPALFSLYLLPLDSIFRKYQIPFHCFADDVQIYMPLISSESIQSLQNCLNEVKDWLSSNFLNLNENKTEVIVFGKPKHIDLGVPPSSCVKNLGVMIDSSFKLDKQISAVVKASFFQLRLIAKVKSYLPSDQLEKLIHVFISARLDYCNLFWSECHLYSSTTAGSECGCSPLDRKEAF